MHTQMGAGCPTFAVLDATLGCMSCKEPLEHMDNLSEWCHGEIKVWIKRARSVAQDNSQSHDRR